MFLPKECMCFPGLYGRSRCGNVCDVATFYEHGLVCRSWVFCFAHSCSVSVVSPVVVAVLWIDVSADGWVMCGMVVVLHAGWAAPCCQAALRQTSKQDICPGNLTCGKPMVVEGMCVVMFVVVGQWCVCLCVVSFVRCWCCCSRQVTDYPARCPKGGPSIIGMPAPSMDSGLVVLQWEPMEGTHPGYLPVIVVVAGVG